MSQGKDSKPWIVVSWFPCQRLLWTECLCLPQIHMLKPNLPWDDTRRWGLWEVMRSWGWTLMNGISAFLEEPPSPPAVWGHHEKPSMDQMLLELLASRSMRKKFPLLISHPSMVCYYSSPNGLRHGWIQTDSMMSTSWQNFWKFNNSCKRCKPAPAQPRQSHI